MRSRSTSYFWKLILVLISGLSPVFGVAQSLDNHASREMQLDFQTAMAAEDRGDLGRAQTLLWRLHTTHPGTFAVDEALGLLLASRGQMIAAIPMLSAAVREQPSSDMAHANLGAAFYHLHQNRSAIAEFERAVQINPNNASSQESLGRIWMDEHRPDRAANAFLAAVGMRPDDEDLKLDCASVLLQADRMSDAQKILASVPGVDGSARAQSLLGEMYEKQGSFQAAAKCFGRAAELDPTEENAWQVGYEYLRHWTFDAAAIEFAAAAAKFPDSTRLRVGLGTALYGASQYVRAIPVFADLLKAQPNNAFYAELLGMGCDSPLPTNVPQCRTLVTYAEVHPADHKAAMYAASWLVKYEGTTKSTVLAKNLLERALAAEPRAPEALLQMAVIKQQQNDWSGSIPFLERAIKLKPNYSEAHYRLALAYWRTGRKQDGQLQMELQKKFAHQEADDLERRLHQVISFTLLNNNQTKQMSPENP